MHIPKTKDLPFLIGLQPKTSLKLRLISTAVLALNCQNRLITHLRGASDFQRPMVHAHTVAYCVAGNADKYVARLSDVVDVTASKQ